MNINNNYNTWLYKIINNNNIFNNNNILMNLMIILRIILRIDHKYINNKWIYIIEKIIRNVILLSFINNKSLYLIIKILYLIIVSLIGWIK